MSRSRSLCAFGRLVALSVAVAIVACVVGYAYLVKIAGYPAVGFFSFKMVVVLLAVSLTVCIILSLLEF